MRACKSSGRSRRRGSPTLVLLAAAAFGCGQNDAPDDAKTLYATIHEGAGFRAWRRAPGFPERKPSFTAHAQAVEVFVNAEVAAALDGPTPITAWPEGSIVVKEGFDGDGDRALVAVMHKRGGRWFWAEYDASGDALYSGEPQVCVGCHDDRKSYSDWVYSFELPR